MGQEKNISLDEDGRQILRDCLSDNKEVALRAQKELAEILAEPIVYNLIKEFSDDWWSREDIIKRVFPPILISGVDEEINDNVIIVGNKKEHKNAQ